MINHIAKLFEIVGPEKHEEAIRWINEFSRVDPSNFGVIKVGGDSIKCNLADLCDGISILASLGLHTPVVYGWGDELSSRLESLKIKSAKHPVTGDRITDMQALYHVIGISYENGHKIVKELKARGIRARLCDDIFYAVPKVWPDVHDKHYTGEVSRVNVNEIKDLIRQGIVPIVSPLGICESGDERLNINGDTAANSLVYELRPLKYIAVNNKGGILGHDGRIIPEILLDENYNPIDRPPVSGGMEKKLNEAVDVLRKLGVAGHRLHFHITLPENVVRELFTDRGKGTYIRKAA